ncbi:MAG: DNA mismatch repair endonuclease MutL [Anaerolineae bacterium]|nr:DNA mismatch repair endonuclease MutL [Anaerolineae bacterium]
MPIRILPPEVSNKIAAGEVVERPASVVKELLENAIDAGADEIQVEIEQGGRRLIRVSDNGSGIPADQAELAFQRHATSKLATIEDLYRVRTLGFRGEALASIAAVSRLTLSTCAQGEEVGTLIRLEGGQVMHRQAQARAQGTTMVVENLFFNTPARLKFMRTDATEAGHVARLVTSYALAYPEKRLALEHNGRQVLRTAGTGQLMDVLVSLYGLDVSEQMLAIPRTLGEESGQDVIVWGFISAPALHRNDRRDMMYFVNRRWILDSTLSFAVSEAYRTLLPQGRHPMVVLNIELPPEAVDVNIHPTKREVRFRDRNKVFSALQRAVRTTLMAQRPVPLMGGMAGADQRWGLRAHAGSPSLSAEQARMALELGRGPGSALRPEAGQAQDEAAPAPGERLPMLRVVGQIAQTYIIAEGPGGMYLIDQHAAHERIRYEELVAQRAGAGVASQELLEPLPIEFSPQQATLLEEQLETLQAFGFEISPFGGSTFLVRRIPASLAGENVAIAISEMVEAAAQCEEGFSWEEQALITLSCHTAVRAGQTLSMAEMRDLSRQLERSQLPHTCPHGRPTMIHLSQAQLEREFGRR